MRNQGLHPILHSSVHHFLREASARSRFRQFAPLRPTPARHTIYRRLCCPHPSVPSLILSVRPPCHPERSLCHPERSRGISAQQHYSPSGVSPAPSICARLIPLGRCCVRLTHFGRSVCPFSGSIILEALIQNDEQASRRRGSFVRRYRSNQVLDNQSFNYFFQGRLTLEENRKSLGIRYLF